MEMKNAVVLGILLVMLAPLASAGAQISTYSITPSILKPGITGTVSITISNPSATEFITEAYLSAKGAGINFVPQIKIGDLGAQGTTEVAIPFTISDTASPGVIPITLELTYTSNLVSGSNYKSFSIPLTISATNVLKITDVKVSQDAIYPGDSFTIEAIIENSGGPIKNGVLSYSSTAAYTFDGTTKIEIGNIASGQRKKVVLPINTGNNITGGYYSIPFTLTFDDAVTASNTETLYFGPVTAIQDFGKFAVSAETIDTFPGGTGTFKIIVKNTGTNELKYFKVALPQTSTFFTPLDFTEKSIDSIKVGETKEVEFAVGIGTNIAPQVYALPLTLTYQTRSGSESVEKTVGVRIGGSPDLSVYLSSTPSIITNDNKIYSISVQVSNTGNTAVRALSVRVNSDVLELLSPPDSFIGTLSLDDYSTVQYDATVNNGVQPGTQIMNVELTYKDPYNELHVENKQVMFEIYPQEIALLTSKQSGNDPLMTIVIVIIVLVALYFGYKRFFKSNMSQKLKLK